MIKYVLAFLGELGFFMPLLACVYYRNHEVFKMRDKKVYYSLCFVTCIALNDFLIDFMGLDGFKTCTFARVLHLGTLYPYLTCYILKSVILVTKYRLNHNQTSQLGKFIGIKGINWPSFVFMIVLSYFIALIDFLATESDIRPCSTSSEFSFVVYFASFLYLAATTLSFIYLYPVKDQYRMKPELSISAAVFCLTLCHISIAYFVFGVHKSYIQESVAIMLYINHIIINTLPLFAIYNYKKKNKNVSENSIKCTICQA